MNTPRPTATLCEDLLDPEDPAEDEDTDRSLLESVAAEEGWGFDD